LYDTPSKYLFSRKKEPLATYQNCKPAELANKIMEDDTNWTPKMIWKRKWYTLKNKIPVYIGYFTAWQDTDGILYFYDDIYNRDEA
jgi:murein L,D-transpeptidase YcbB/YkuD